MKDPHYEHNAVTDGVLADLFWKLRLHMESRLGTRLDIHRLRKDMDYRDAALDKARASGDAELLAMVKTIERRLAQLRTPDGDGQGRLLLARSGPLFGAAAVLLVMVMGALYFFGGGLADGVPGAGVPESVTPLAGSPQPAQRATARPAVPARTLFRLHGSNTLGEKLAPALVQQYLVERGAVDILVENAGAAQETVVKAHLDGVPVQVEIHAHGSSTAFSGLASGSADIGMASRRVKDDEVEQLRDTLGDLTQPSAEHVVALDGLAVIVHPALPVAELSAETIARLFAGEITNWRELGGPDLAVELFARDDNSGTWDSFSSMILKPHGHQLSASARRIESSQELSDGVADTPGAIGFIGLPYVRQARLLAVSAVDGALPVIPNNFTVSTEDYALSRRLFLYLPTDAGLEARQFIDFVRGTSGQGVVADVGFISQNITATRPALAVDLPSDYLGLIENAERLSVNFRFETGSSRIDNKGQRDLDRLADFVLANPGRRIMLFGFADSVGDPARNVELSRSRAELVSRELMKLGIFPFQVSGFGAAAAVASNDNEEGRNRNRRVEVWVI